jgi:hypothetical protein
MIRVCTGVSMFLNMLSPADRIAAQSDLIMFGMFTIDDDGDVVRRVDPRLVRIQQQSRREGLVSGLIEDRVVMLPSGSRAGNGARSALADILRSTNCSIASTTWRPNNDLLPIWRKHDPGAT